MSFNPLQSKVIFVTVAGFYLPPKKLQCHDKWVQIIFYNDNFYSGRLIDLILLILFHLFEKEKIPILFEEIKIKNE